jgi:hypothetical protein
MNKASAAATLASVVACAAFVFAALEFRRMSASVGDLGERVGKLESGAPAAPDQGAKAADGSSPAATGTDLAREVAALREELAAARAGGGSGGPALRPDGSVAGGDPLNPAARPPAIDKDDVARAVTDALEAKAKADKEKQKKQYEKQMVASAKSYAAQIAKQLGLTETQKEELTRIYAEQWTKMSGGWYGGQMDEDAEPVDYTALQNETNERVKAILTPEQQTKYDEIMKKQNWGGLSSGEESDESSESNR